MYIIADPDTIAVAMTATFQEKCDEIKKKFAPLSTEQRYDALIEMGRRLPPFPADWKIPSRVVSGCQSTLYLYADMREGKIFFQAHSDALISLGLAAMLIAAYSGESPETILKCPPQFIAALKIGTILSPNRSNGLSHIHLRMKQEALAFLMKS